MSRGAAVCRACGEPVRWVTTTRTGSRMPLDLSPDPAGVWRVHPSGPAPGRGRARLLAEKLGPDAHTAAQAEGELLFTSHLDTCPADRPPNPAPAAARALLADALAANRQRRHR